MAAGETVTITLVTTPSAAGTQTNTVTVVRRPAGDEHGQQHGDRDRAVTGRSPPPVFCVAVSKVTPKQLFVGRKTTLTIHLTKHGKAVSGVHVRIKGPKLDISTKASNAQGRDQADREDEEGRDRDLHPDRQQGLQHQADRRDGRLHPAGDRVSNTPEGAREDAPRPLRVTGVGSELLAQWSSIGLSTSPFW